MNAHVRAQWRRSRLTPENIHSGRCSRYDTLHVPASSREDERKMSARARNRETFISHYTHWRAATGRIRSPSELAAHLLSQKLISCEDSVDFMIEELQRAPCRLVYLLEAKTGQRPYQGIDAGDVKAMAQRWTDWYHTRRIAAE